MKRFEFRLEKALAWRQTQVRMAETALELLQSELRHVESQMTKVTSERDRAGRNLIASGAATGVELAFLESFRQAADVELLRLAGARGNCRQRVEAQMKVVMERRRDARALERLREKRLAGWNADLNRELDEQASESFLARWGIR